MSGPEDTGGPPYLLSVEGSPPDLLRVQSFRGREALSELWAFEISVTSESNDEGGLEARLLRRRASLVWSIAGARRTFHGVISAARLVEAGDGHGRRSYLLQLVPRLWLLKKRRRSRIFQGKSVPEVVKAVLRESGIDARFRLLRDHPPRNYCTQYEETDHRFVTRLLAEEGLWFTFASGTELSPGEGALVPGDTLLLGDGALYPPIGGDDAAAMATDTVASAGKLYVLSQGMSTVSQLDKVFRFEPESRVRSSAAAFRDYDPERPMARLAAEARSNHPFPEPSSKDEATGDLEVYEHHGPYLFPSWSFATEEPHLMLRQKRRRAATAEGESGCPDLAPGYRFALSDHPAPHVDREYVVVEVTHRGKSRPGAGERERVYENSFEVVPAEVVYPPRRPRRKSTQVSLTATVVGPRGEEIHTDGFGQIRVQFHWDREGKNDQHSSCWIRSMHPWAGAGWGAQFIPRVGMEVVVVFDGGDPDKPMVIGCLYNGTHPPPFRLPGQKTRSGFRSQTTPASGGHNEISFEDTAHHEQIYLHAERDLDEVVGHDHSLTVHADERIEVTGARLDVVHGGLRSTIRGGVEQTVTGHQQLTLEGSRVDTVSGDRDERVRGASQTRVEGPERREVKGAAELIYEDDHTLRVRGSLTTVVGKHDAPRSYTLRTEGQARLGATGAMEISSDKEIVLRVGKSLVRITESGIELSAPGVTVLGESASIGVAGDGLKLQTKESATLVVGKKLVLKTEGASFAMEKEVKIDGEKILLNSPEKAKDEAPKPPDPPTIVVLSDQDGAPITHRRFLVLLDDGTELSGITDEEGRAELPLKSSGKITFPDLGEVRPG